MAIHRYSDEFAERWDAFVLDSSVNGNFLQTRQFLSYHPDDRFKDYSLMYFDAREACVLLFLRRFTKFVIRKY